MRAVYSIDRRGAEAAKLGFGHCIIPRDNMKQVDSSETRITGVTNLAEAIDAALES